MTTPHDSTSTPKQPQTEQGDIPVSVRPTESGIEGLDILTFEVIEQEVTDGKPVVSKGVYLAPNLITTLSLLSGFFSVLSSMQGHFYKASLAIFLSAILDGADGRVARMLNAQSPFGEQYDSLADMLAFGVAPAILIYSFALQPLGRVGIGCAFIFTACAAFRLARFNVQIGEVDKKYFVGLASPLAAILVTSAVMVAVDHNQWVGQYEDPKVGAQVVTLADGTLLHGAGDVWIPARHVGIRHDGLPETGPWRGGRACYFPC